MQQENQEEVFSRINVWRDHVLKELAPRRTSEAGDQKLSDVSGALKLLGQMRLDRGRSLSTFRKIINDILLEPTLHTSDRRRVLELCCKSALEQHDGDLSFTSLLYEPLDSVKLPPLVFELLRLPQDALNFCDFEVALYLIQNWDGSLIAFPTCGSCDILRTVKKACLRRGDRDSGNSIFQNLKMLLWENVIKPASPKFTRNPIFAVNVFPLLPSTPTNRAALLSPADRGFSACIFLPDFPAAIHDVITDIWSDPGQKLPQSERRNLITPSSSSPSQWHSALLPNSALQIDFLACGCAWVFEIGRNHLKLCIVDSDGSIEKDALLVSASVEVSSLLLTARCPGGEYRFTFPESYLCIPSHPRTGPNFVQILQCFPCEPSSHSDVGQSLPHNLTGFDDARLFDGSSEDLSVKLRVRVEMQRKAHVSLIDNKALEASFGQLSLQETDSHRRSRSVPDVRVTEPSSSANSSRATMSSINPQFSPLISAQGMQSQGLSDTTSCVVGSHQTTINANEPPEMPISPPSYAEVALQSVVHPDNLTGRSSHSAHPRSRSETPAIVHSSETQHTLEGDADGRLAVPPTVNTPRPFRPLPKPPTLSIDTVNIIPSHINTPPQTMKELAPMDIPSLTRRDGNSSDPSPSPSTATYKAMTGPDATPRGTSSSPQYTLPNVPPLFSMSLPDTKISSVNSSNIERVMISDRNGSTSQSAPPQPKKKATSPQNMSNLDDWRSTILYEIEETHSVSLPHNRTPSTKSSTKLAQLYPFTTHYGLQYLIWLGKHDSSSGVPTALTLAEFVQSWQAIPIVKAVANHRKMQNFLSGIAQFAERQRKMNKTDFSWDLVFRHSFKRDIDDLARVTTILVGTGGNILQDVIGLDSAEISQFMDLLQSFIDRRIGSHRQLERFLRKIVNASGQLPRYLFISGVRRLGENPVGGGGFADVWEGEVNNRRVGLKVIRIFGLASPQNELHQDFCKEAMLWRQFRHQNVLPFYGVCTDEFSPQLAMVSPWMENGDVVSYLKRKPLANRCTLTIGVALGLQYLHSLRPQVVHGDLRAANVLVDKKGRPKLADFGLSKIVDSQATTVARPSFNGKGAMRWQSPELLDSSRFNGIPCVVTTSSDVYAFASLCLEIFTEEVPFAHLRDGAVVMEVVVHNRRPPRPPEPALQRGLNDNMWNLMQHCWAGSPIERPAIDHIVELLSTGCP